MSEPRGGTDAGLLEREPDLTRIARSLGLARERHGMLLSIEGPAGIGKTALVQAACRQAERSQFVVLRARGGELERGFPYGVLRQLFEAHLARLPPADRAVLLGGAAQLAAPAVTSDSAVATAGTSPDASFAVAHGIYWLAANMAEQAPLVIAVDDAQWADLPSLRCLAHVARRLEGMPVLVAVCIRPGEPEAPAALLSELTSQEHAEVMRPAPLSEAGIARILAVRLAEEPDDEFTRACHHATGGVPFLAVELAAALAARGVRPGPAALSQVEEVGAGAVADAAVRRLARLPASAAALARAVAVLGSDGRLDRAARLAGLELDEAAGAADALAAMRILRSDRPLDFVHAIVRRAIYEALPVNERATAHGRAADLLTRDGAELDLIATQLLRSAPTGRTDVVERLREAAGEASARGAAENAATYLRRALEEGGFGSEGRAALLLELGRAEKLTDPHVAIERFRLAYELAREPVSRAWIVHDLADTLFYFERWKEAVGLVDSALSDVLAVDRELAVRLEVLRAGAQYPDARLLGGFLERLPRLREMAREQTPAGRMMSLLLSGAAAWMAAPVHEIRALREHGLRGEGFLAEPRPDWLFVHMFSGIVLADDLAEALRVADEAAREWARQGAFLAHAVALSHRAWAYSRRGDLVSAEADMRSALDRLREDRVLGADLVPLWYCADALVERPELADEAERLLRSDPGAIPESFVYRPMLHEVRGRLQLARGDTSAAVAELGNCERALVAHGNPNAWGWKPALALALAPKEKQRALRHAGGYLEHAESVGLPRAVGVGLRTLGAIEGGAKGLRRLGDAVEILEGSPAPLEHARALVELGSARRRANQRVAALEPLRRGLDMADRCGATRLAMRAHQELVIVGARPRRARLTGAGALTATERRIAGMAAGGLSNPQIAQSLFLSRKTVENHLGRVYRKLDISSRDRLAEALDDGN